MHLFLAFPNSRLRAVVRSASSRSVLSLAASLLLLAGLSAAAQGTKLWTQSRYEELERGTPQGVEITSDGKLRAGPVASEILTTPSSFVWSVAVDGSGTAFLATGAPSTVLRVGPDGKTTKIFETKAVAVQVLRFGLDGALYAATIPDGKVYRLKPGAATPEDEKTAEVVLNLGKADAADAAAKPDAAKSEAKSHYIWDMTFDQAGRLYVATGGPGAIYRIDLKEKPDSLPEPFFKSDEQHIRVLAWDKAGNLLAGCDGSGLVYRIDTHGDQGKGYVLFSAPRREITALASADDGSIFASDVGDRSRNPLPQLPVQNGNTNSITITILQPSSVQAANASSTLPDGTEIYILKPGQAPRKIWASKDDIVYNLTSAAGGVMALTGNRGRILSIRGDGTYSDLGHLDAQQATSIAAVAGGWLIGTANSGKLYRLENAAKAGKADDHFYASDVLDTGALSRWGRLETTPSSAGFHLWTRTGNVEQPVRSQKDWGWSEWQPAAGDKIASPPGRYLQWKVAINPDGVVGDIGVNYLPVNAAPAVDDVLVVPGARVPSQQGVVAQPGTITIAFPNAGQNGGVSYDANANNPTAPIQAQKDRSAVTVRWTSHDDNGDDMTYDLYLRGDGEHTWRPLKKGLTERIYSFDAASIPDGGYEIKVVASDAPSHTPGDALSGELISDRFEIDTTAPVITGLKAGAAMPGKNAKNKSGNGAEPRSMSIPVMFEAKDAVSPIGHAEYSLDAGPWQYIEPVGGLSDALEEHYAISIPLPPNADAEPEHLVTVRVYDRHDNMAVAKTIVPAAGGEK